LPAQRRRQHLGAQILEVVAEGVTSALLPSGRGPALRISNPGLRPAQASRSTRRDRRVGKSRNATPFTGMKSTAKTIFSLGKRITSELLEWLRPT
jgi:hypothetical protein